MNEFNTIIDKLQNEGVFLGGPKNLFELAGQKLLITLLSQGLTPFSKVLDVGCGCLRGGHWLIRLLNKNSYFGIEPNGEMLNAGLNILLDPIELEIKKPQFSDNDNFNFSIFNEQFDFIIARSIWTHSSRLQIKLMLDSFVNTTHKNSIFLTSYKNTSNLNSSYLGTDWVGKSHESNEPGIVHHSFDWIKEECLARNLDVTEINEQIFNFSNQIWLKVSHQEKDQ